MGHEAVGVAADAYVDEAKFCEAIPEYDVYVSGGLEDCTKAVIDSAHKLKAIVFLGVDYKDYIDEKAAKSRNIPIFNTPGGNSRAVAELTIMLLLMAARNAAKMLEDSSQKKWAQQTGFELKGKTLGLVGSGPIAAQVAQIAAGFDMSVLYWSRSGEKPDMPGQYCAWESLLSRSDLLSLHVPKDAGVLIDRNALKQMKTGSILINTARAALVDPESLYDALKSNHILCAGFDVFYTEGKDTWTCPQSNLFSLGADKFFMTPHAGWCSREAHANLLNMAVAAIAMLT